MSLWNAFTATIVFFAFTSLSLNSWRSSTTEDENLVMRLAGPLALIEPVGLYARRERDVAGGREEDPVALAALAEVQDTGALEVRSVSGSDLDAESTGEGAADVGGGI